MSRHRDFAAARAESEPLTFTLAGHAFTIDRVPAGPLLDLADQATLTDEKAMAAFARFMHALVREEERATLRAALDETDLQTVLEIVQWVIEESTGRPLPTASSSPGEPSQDGAPSRVVSLSPVESQSA